VSLTPSSSPDDSHRVEGVHSAGLQPFDSLARDFVGAYAGDVVALSRLNERLPGTKDLEGLRQMVRQLRRPSDADEDRPFTLADARTLVSQRLGFGSWDRLAASVAQPPSNPRTAPHGLSITPPFYRIDWKTNTLQPRQPLTDADWDVIIEVIREHAVTGVNGNGQVTDSALERLSHLEHVTALELGGSKRLTDEGLQHLARMPQLETLDLSEYPGGQITDRGLEVLRHLRELRRFNMCWQSGITDAGVANLSACEQIERVDLLGSPTGDGAIEALRGKRQLRLLKSGRLVTDAGLGMLHDFPVFKTWQGGEPSYDLTSFEAGPNFLMVDGPFSDAGFASVAGLEGVFGLAIFWHASELTSDGLHPLTTLPHLGALSCQGQLCDDTAMRHIATLPHLRMLMAQGTVASDEGFITLSRSRTLENIWGRECPNLHSRGFKALAEMPALRGLAVSCKQVDDHALSTLPRFPALTSLVPIDVTDDGFRHIGGCTRLEKLTCMYCRETGDIATKHIAGLSRLRHYYAGQTRITDRSLEILGRMTTLEEVELSACAGISDAGLAHLTKLPRLNHLAVDASAHVTRAGIAAFPGHVHVNFWT
jgi:hypothetical protein